MPFVVAPRRPGCKPSLIASMPASLFGTFAPNGRGVPAPAEQQAKNKRMRDALDELPVAHPKENVSQSGAYMAAVRTLACRRCGYRKSEFAHADQGKGKGIKTDVRRGAALCGKRGQKPGCHWLLGTSGQIPKEERRELEKQYAKSTRAEVRARGLWPKRLGEWDERRDAPKAAKK